MQLEWYGQSAFRLTGAGKTVAVDPFGDMSALTQSHGVQWDYPPIVGLEAELLLVTHEHRDHNAVEIVGGDPVVLRSTAGTLESPLGTVIAVASEHDEFAGTQRGPNTIFAFDLDGVRVCHMGDFGQAGLREEQAGALEGIELLIVPVGGGPTIGARAARAVVERLRPRWVVPMHYRTPRIGFLETAEEFVGLFEDVMHVGSPSFGTAELGEGAGPVVVVPTAP